MATHCSTCGHRVAAAVRFCTFCGALPFQRLAGRRAGARPPCVRHEDPAASLFLPTRARRRVEAHFTVLDERGPEATLGCPHCECEFEVNAYAGQNLFIDRRRGSRVAVCPRCGAVEK
jgi:hypothetical protein